MNGSFDLQCRIAAFALEKTICHDCCPDPPPQGLPVCYNIPLIKQQCSLHASVRGIIVLHFRLLENSFPNRGKLAPPVSGSRRCESSTAFKFEYFSAPQDDSTEVRASGNLPWTISDHCVAKAVKSAGGFSSRCCLIATSFEFCNGGLINFLVDSPRFDNI